MLSIGLILLLQLLSSPTEWKLHQAALNSWAPERQYCLLYKVLHYLPTFIKKVYHTLNLRFSFETGSTGWWVNLFHQWSASALFSIPDLQHGLWQITSAVHCVHTMQWGSADLSWQVPWTHAVLHLSHASWLSRSCEPWGTASTAKHYMWAQLWHLSVVLPMC